MHFVQNNQILKSIFSFLPPAPLQNQLFHCEKKNLLTFLVQDLLTHCITLYELCSNCTVLTPVFSHFLVFLLSRYCRVLYHRGTMGHSGMHHTQVCTLPCQICTIKMCSFFSNLNDKHSRYSPYIPVNTLTVLLKTVQAYKTFSLHDVIVCYV